MSRVNAAQAIRAIGSAVFTTRQIAALRGSTLSATSQALAGMEKRGLVKKVTRGVWCIPDDPRFSRYSLVPLLAGGHRAVRPLAHPFRLRQRNATQMLPRPLGVLAPTPGDVA